MTLSSIVFSGFIKLNATVYEKKETKKLK